MLRRIIFFNALCVYFLVSTYVINPGPSYPPTKGKVWPKPQQQTKNDTYFKLSPHVFKFKVTGKTCTILTAAVERYTAVLMSTHELAVRHANKIRKYVNSRSDKLDARFKGTLEELRINLTAPCEVYPHMDMDEKYSLNVSTVSTLESNSIWGVLRGMESFAQLFYMSNGYKEVFINTTQIVDFPAYTHRGLLIDTSRHYLTVENILKALDGMEMNKMNVLHWHIVDDQSFPYESAVFPQLSEKGAYDPSMVYTKENIDAIVAYARDRGIRVLPEFDVPGHTSSWGVAYPGILTECFDSKRETMGLGPMDPSNNSTYKLIGELFREVQERFPDEYFHLGGDEVSMDCWASNTKLAGFMKEHNMTKTSELHAYFMTKVIPLLKKKSKPIVWQEVFDEGVKLPSDAIVEVWRFVGPQSMIPILAANHKLIYSASWYLDYLSGGGDWVKFYTDDPRRMIPEQYSHYNLDNIVGGEACMWGEAVDDRNFISRVWPRTSPVAEVLWTAEPHFGSWKVTDADRSRLEEHACRMNRRGVHAQPPNGPGFCVGGV